MRIRTLFIIIGFICYAMAHAQSSSEIRAYIDRYKQIALEEERKHGIPASITLAQGILESAAGKSTLARNSNNHFGIKRGNNWTGPVFYAWDDDPQKSPFRCYSNPEDSYRDHSKFLMEHSRYSRLFNLSPYDYRGWAKGLQAAGYATNPNYAKGLIGYIDTYQLYAVNGGVKLRGDKVITIVKTITVDEIAQKKDIQLADDEESEEEECVRKVSVRYVSDINDVRCTILYPGKSLSTIAMEYNVPKSELLEYNEVDSEMSIKEGDIVFVEKKKKKYEGPHYDYHRVKEGETLHHISQEYGIRVLSLCKMNHMTIFDQLKEGQKIKLR